MEEIDRDRAETIAGEILLAVRRNYLAGPSSRHRVFEALNATAFAAAAIIVSADTESGALHQARAFFDQALASNLLDMRRNPAGNDA